MTVTGDGSKAGDAVIANEIVNLSSFDVDAAEVASAKAGKSGPGDRLVNSAGRFCGSARISNVPTVLPQISRSPWNFEMSEEPCLLLHTQDSLRNSKATLNTRGNTVGTLDMRADPQNLPES